MRGRKRRAVARRLRVSAPAASVRSIVPSGLVRPGRAGDSVSSWKTQRVGVAPPPAYLGNTDPQIVRVMPDLFRVRRLDWVAVPRELERLQRVRTVCAFLRSVVSAHADLEPGWHPAGRSKSTPAAAVVLRQRC